MSVWATIQAALVAIPEIVEQLELLQDAIKTYRNTVLESELSEYKEKYNTLTKKLQNAETRDEVADIIRDLNSI